MMSLPLLMTCLGKTTIYIDCELVRERRHIDVGLCLFKSFISKKNCNPPSKSPLFIFFEVVTHLIKVKVCLDYDSGMVENIFY
jgi:hypothetical protein